MNIFSWANEHLNEEKEAILITGASSGIGLEYLKLLSDIACTIYIVSEEMDALESIAQELMKTKPSNIIPLYCDFSEISQVDDLVMKLETLNIKVLINNAGVGIKGEFTGCSYNDVDRMYNINVCTPLKILLAVLPPMLEQNNGVVIQVTTLNVVAPIPFSSLYSGGKSGLSATFSAIMYEVNNRYEANSQLETISSSETKGIAGTKNRIVFHEVRPGTTASRFHERQGAEPQSMVMTSEDVARRSLFNIHKKVYYPNRIDRLIVKIGVHLPLLTKMKIAHYFVKKRLGITASSSSNR